MSYGFPWLPLCFGIGLLCGWIATLFWDRKPQRWWRRWRSALYHQAQERRGGKLCRCRAVMHKEYGEAGMGSMHGGFDPWAVVCWRCDACGRTCVEVFDRATDEGERERDRWYDPPQREGA